jgi:hypothetical protein
VKPERWDDRAEAAVLGEEFGLGEVQAMACARSYPLSARLGLPLAGMAVIFGMPVIIKTAGWAEAISAAAFGTVVAGCCVWHFHGVSRAQVTGRIYRYSGGLAEFSGDPPELRVARWADIETVTVTFWREYDTTPTITAFLVRTSDGTELACYERYATSVLHGLAAEAGRVLTPRMVAPLIETFESGQPVTVGGTRIDQSGITVGLPGGRLIPWAGIDLITIDHVTSYGQPAIAHEIGVHQCADTTSTAIVLSGVPNGIFLAPLVARAAAQHGVPVRRTPRKLPALDDSGSKGAAPDA